MADVARAARRDHGDVDRIGDGARDGEVVARRRAVAVDAVHDDLPGAEVLAAPDPLEGVETRRAPCAVDEHLVAARDPVTSAHVAHLGGEHHALAPEGLGALADEVGVAHRHRIDADLLGPRLQHFIHVVDRSDSATYREGHEHVVRHPPHGVEVDLAPLHAGGDVVEHDLVDLVVVEGRRKVLGGRDVDVVEELLRLRDAAVHDVEAGDEALRQHDGSQAANPRSSASPSGPLFSAWNCVATMLPWATTEQNSSPYSVMPSASSASRGTQ